MKTKIYLVLLLGLPFLECYSFGQSTVYTYNSKGQRTKREYKLTAVLKSIEIDTTSQSDLNIDLQENSFSDPSQIILSPNPTSGMVEISTRSDLNADIHIEILNMQNICVLDFTYAGNLVHADLSSFPPGVYFVRISYEGMSMTKKLVRK